MSTACCDKSSCLPELLGASVLVLTIQETFLTQGIDQKKLHKSLDHICLSLASNKRSNSHQGVVRGHWCRWTCCQVWSAWSTTVVRVQGDGCSDARSCGLTLVARRTEQHQSFCRTIMNFCTILYGSKMTNHLKWGGQVELHQPAVCWGAPSFQIFADCFHSKNWRNRTWLNQLAHHQLLHSERYENACFGRTGACKMLKTECLLLLMISVVVVSLLLSLLLFIVYCHFHFCVWITVLNQVISP